MKITAAFFVVMVTLVIVANLVLLGAALTARRLSARAADAELKHKRLRDYYFIVAVLGIADFTILLYLLFGKWGLFGLSAILPAIVFMRSLMRRNEEV
ncbi:MAG TPA: hypothetical protein VFZ58_03285 [Candidatus Saccharimonadales bacterium]